MSSLPLYTRDEIHQLVHDFYREVRQHPTLGPIFDQHIHDWDSHLDIMVNFWSSLLCRDASYSGSPMQKHAQLPQLNEAHFQMWLDLFHTTSSQHPNPQLAQQAQAYARRIARSLWLGYQYQQQPDQLPSELHYAKHSG
ncbi:MAG TPA: group III truncated hemoglobin [Candidatus Paenalcaligenes intestinipullorum]|uniref:Group III truncated hemoglobin n=1 Tax=Candidatus Paenalcaligenes intestinipullorum TaxID=2838718 RepID=A0A9D2U841_9BURK|nr:group III truncated hemoglobin [Candidatus Paenalcaligenes intestinipullorum]